MSVMELISLELAIFSLLVTLLAAIGAWFGRKLRQELKDATQTIAKVLQEALAPAQTMANDMHEMSNDIKQVKKNSFEAKSSLDQANERLGEAVEKLGQNQVDHREMITQQRADTESIKDNIENLDRGIEALRRKA